ncbi:MAG: lysophospholipid acyltransferase family protein [Vicinamibacteria bacterium]|nr:lysophospholipid acyltransferase family protein [Vicinamibacteria bacterium]
MTDLQGQTLAGPPAPPRRWTLHALNNGLIFRLTLAGVRHLPRPVSYAMARVASWLAWRLMPATNDAIADNLHAVFPDEDLRRRRTRALDVYRSYTLDAVDFIRALRADPEELRHMFSLAPGDRQVFEGLTAAGRGAIIVTGHFGNWECGAILMRRVLDLPLTVVAMREASPAVNRMRLQIRNQLGVPTLEVRQSIDTALQIRRALGENRAVALLMDRHVGRDRVAVTLLGRTAWFLRTPALLAYLTGAPLVPCFIERTGPARFRAVLGQPVELSRDEPRDVALARAVQHVADALEARIRARPDCWYHFYRYWDAQRDEYSGLD